MDKGYLADAANRQVFSLPEVVRNYISEASLQEPEKAIFLLLQHEFPAMHVLDIGVGAGRTTGFLAEKVKEYKAMDYSEEMIRACKEKFNKFTKSDNLITGDARSISRIYAGHQFDFILFSFNGIDYMPYPDRADFFLQVRSLLKPAGCFCFSTHNIQAVSEWGKIKFGLNPLSAIKLFFLERKRLSLNQSLINDAKTADYLILNDGAHHFSLSTCYTRPSVQKKMLEESGFPNVRIWDLKGNECADETAVNSSKDPWLTYLCSL